MASEKTVAVLGAGGTMGQPMARNIADAGFAVRAWNRSRDKAEPLGDHGVTVCDSPAEAADGADIILTMLADTDAVVESVSDALGQLGKGGVWLQMSTIGEAGTERCSELASHARLTFVDAPVLGAMQNEEMPLPSVMSTKETYPDPSGAITDSSPLFTNDDPSV